MDNSARKEDKNLPFMTIWMDLEDLLQQEISHMEKDKPHMTSLKCIIKIQKQNSSS